MLQTLHDLSVCVCVCVCFIHKISNKLSFNEIGNKFKCTLKMYVLHDPSVCVCVCVCVSY